MKNIKYPQKAYAFLNGNILNIVGRFKYSNLITGPSVEAHLLDKYDETGFAELDKIVLEQDMSSFDKLIFGLE